MTQHHPALPTANGLLSPLTTLLVMWGFAFAMYYSDVVHFDKLPDSWGILYLLLCLTVFCLSFAIPAFAKPGRFISPRNTEHDKARRLVHARGLYPLISVCAVAGIIASLLFAAEMIFFVGVDPFNFEGTRALFVEREVTGLSRLASVIGAGGFFSLVAAILCWEDLTRRKRTLWLLSPALLTVFSILSAGRQTVLQLIVLVVFAVLLRLRAVAREARRVTHKWIAASLAMLALAVAYGLMAGRERTEQISNVSKKDLLFSIFDARPDPRLDTLLDQLPPKARDGAAEFLIYFGHEIPNFLVFWESPLPGPYYGLWELPFLARRLENLHLVSTSVEDRMATVYARFAESGRFPQVWQTWIRDLVIDFGRWGAPVVIFFLGVGAGRAYRAFRRHPSLSSSFLVLGIHLCCVYSVMLASVSDTLVFFYMTGALILYHRGRRHERRRRVLRTSLLTPQGNRISSIT